MMWLSQEQSEEQRWTCAYRKQHVAATWNTGVNKRNNTFQLVVKQS